MANSTNIMSIAPNQAASSTRRTSQSTQPKYKPAARQGRKNFGATLDKVNAKIDEVKQGVQDLQDTGKKLAQVEQDAKPLDDEQQQSAQGKSDNPQDAPQKATNIAQGEKSVVNQSTTPDAAKVIAEAKVQPADIFFGADETVDEQPVETAPPEVETQIDESKISDAIKPVKLSLRNLLWQKTFGTPTTAQPDEKISEDDAPINSAEKSQAQPTTFTATANISAYFFAQNSETPITAPVDTLATSADLKIDAAQKILPAQNLQTLLPQTEGNARSMLNLLGGKSWRLIETPPAQVQPAQVQPTLQTLEQPAQVQSTLQTLEQPAQIQPTLQTLEQSAQAQPTVQTSTQPAQVQSTLQTLEQPAQVQPTLQTTEQPAQIQPTLQTSTQPAQIQPTLQTSLQTLEQPAQVQPTLQTTEQPAQIQPTLQTSTQPAQIQPTLQTLEQSAQVQSTLQTSTQPAQVQPTLQTSAQPAQVQPTLQTSAQPAQVQPTVQTSAQPAQVQPTLQTLEQPAQIQPTLQTSAQPAQVQSTLQTSEQPAQVQPTAQTSTQPAQVQPTAQTSAQPAQIQPTLQTLEQPAEIQPALQVQAESVNIQPQAQVQPAAQIDLQVAHPVAQQKVDAPTVQNLSEMLGVNVPVDDASTAAPVTAPQAAPQHFTQDNTPQRDTQNFSQQTFTAPTEIQAQPVSTGGEIFSVPLTISDAPQTQSPAPTQAPDAPPPPPQEDFDVPAQIVRQARLIRTAENTEMVIKLNPEHLGNLTLKISVSANGAVNASFHSDNAQVRTIIENSLVQLRQELNNQGLKVENVQVYAGLSEDGGLMNGQGGQAWQQNRQQRQGNRRISIETIERDAENISAENVAAEGVDYSV